MITPLSILAGLGLSGLFSLFAIRESQRFMVHSVAELLEFIQPERERQGNGLAILGKAFFSSAMFLYIVGAWCALSVALPRAAAQQTTSVPGWILYGVGFIWCLFVIPWSTKSAIGIRDPKQLIAYVNIKTKARWEKADGAAMFAIASSTIIFWLAVIAWVIFAMWSSPMQWLYGWLVFLVSYLSTLFGSQVSLPFPLVVDSFGLAYALLPSMGF